MESEKAGRAERMLNAAGEVCDARGVRGVRGGA